MNVQHHRSITEARTAWFSECGLYRYRLDIVWGSTFGLMLVALMLNPSTASHLENDPTVARICERARRLGFAGVIILNAFAWRETDRLKMLKVDDPVGAANDNAIRDVLRLAGERGWTVLVGWGNEGGHRDRHLQIAELLDEAAVQAVCLKVCANGQPGHPLYIGYDQAFMPWPAA